MPDMITLTVIKPFRFIAPGQPERRFDLEAIKDGGGQHLGYKPKEFSFSPDDPMLAHPFIHEQYADGCIEPAAQTRTRLEAERASLEERLARTKAAHRETERYTAARAPTRALDIERLAKTLAEARAGIPEVSERLDTANAALDAAKAARDAATTALGTAQAAAERGRRALDESVAEQRRLEDAESAWISRESDRLKASFAADGRTLPKLVAMPKTQAEINNANANVRAKGAALEKLVADELRARGALEVATAEVSAADAALTAARVQAIDELQKQLLERLVRAEEVREGLAPNGLDIPLNRQPKVTVEDQQLRDVMTHVRHYRDPGGLDVPLNSPAAIRLALNAPAEAA